jgi:ATP-dependent DNA helicase RecG
VPVKISIPNTAERVESTTRKMPQSKYLSVLRNPIIAGVFHRTGLIDQWGRGTNRVVEMCRAAGIGAPVFQEEGPFAVVTFRVRVGSTPQVTVALQAARQAISAADLQTATGLKDRMHFLRSYLQPLIQTGWLERTIPDKPKSRLQRYRTTAAGFAALQEQTAREQLTTEER